MGIVFLVVEGAIPIAGSNQPRNSGPEICSGSGPSNLGLRVPNCTKSCSVVLKFITFLAAPCLFTLPNRKSYAISKYEVHKSRIVLVEEGAASPWVARPNSLQTTGLAAWGKGESPRSKFPEFYSS